MIILKSDKEIEIMRLSGRITALTLRELEKYVEEGITTMELDGIAEKFIKDAGGIPAFKGYRNFPNSITVSLNEEVVHGIPSKRKLKNGDVVSMDFGVMYDGFYSDAAISVGVGSISEENQRLIDVARSALDAAIKKAIAGNRLTDISHCVQSHVESNGFSVVRDLVGHGIGRSLHEDPQIPNFGSPGRGPKLEAGMTLAIEPMINAGDYRIKVKEDKWTVVTEDGSFSAHFEHTVAITNNGPVILTSP